VTDFLKMDIFFVVTTVAVVVITGLVSLVLVRAYRILGQVNEVSQIVQEEAREVKKDFERLRTRIKSILHLP